MTYYFAASDYFATGEGKTICLLATMAYPREQDYKVQPRIDFDKGEYVEGELKGTMEDVVKREFTELFGDWFAQGIEHHSEEKFMKIYGHLVPEHVKEMLASDDGPGNFRWYQQWHFNFS